MIDLSTMTKPEAEPRWNTRELRGELNRFEEELRASGKTRNTINTYVQHPERFINWLEGRYRPTMSTPNWKPDPTAGSDERRRSVDGRRGSSRYDPLQAYLAERPD